MILLPIWVEGHKKQVYKLHYIFRRYSKTFKAARCKNLAAFIFRKKSTTSYYSYQKITLPVKSRFTKVLLSRLFAEDNN